ncbi:uncharacterized protein LOC108105401 [Drosophila eugracilis]|uniref:uncharacterized protein LOC108105401 n=1 Tax=Drosophila eugracilis TaxID=29029 RepID=UPI0007E6A9F2|nr:uncharacterized protein LOC108105401 [Drosophila eugracilis]
MPLFVRNLPMIRHLARRSLIDGRRSLTTILGLEKAQGKDWPVREESFAAVQLLRQRQQHRQWSNNVYHLDSAMFRPVVKPDEIGSQRNNVVAAQNAAKRRDAKLMQLADAHAREQQQQQQQEDYEEQLGREPEAKDEDHDYESDLEIRSVREAVFGPPEDNYDEELDRAREAQELLQRVTATASKQEEGLTPRNSISRKVISPYNSYRRHRTRWAEFRHTMIYGRTCY